MTRTIAVTVIAWMLLAARPAIAQPEAPHARGQRLFDEGAQAFERGEYDQAIAKFEDAYPLYPEPLILFNIASAYRKQHACVDARTYYRRYLQTNPDAAYRKKAEERLAEMEACANAATTPPLPPPDVTPPDITPPDVTPPDAATITSTPSETRTAHARPGRGKRIAGLVTAGVGVALIGTGGYFSAQARRAAGDVEDTCTGGCVADDVAGRDADGKAAQRNATICYAAGGAAVAIGATLAIWGWRDGRTATDHVALIPSRTGAIAVAGWSF